MSERIHRPGSRDWAVQFFGEELSGSRIYDLLVLACVSAAFLSAIKNMGGAAPAGIEWPARWLAAGLALHAHALYDRGQNDRARLRLLALLPASAALWLLLDGLIHPALAWKSHEAATTAALAATALWLTAHHTRHLFHRKFVYGTIAVACAGLGTMTLSNSNTLLARFAGRTADSVYAEHATGPFGTPGEFVALMLIGFFLSLSHTIFPRRRLALNFSSGYLALIAILGIHAANTAAGWYGVLAGFTVMALLRFRHAVARTVTLLLAGGAAWLIKTNLSLEFGLFRNHDGVTPLPDAAVGIFRSNPLAGVGSGGFASAFESHRPACWSLDPDSAGGLFHTLLAEHGAIGAIVMLAPTLALVVLAWRHLARLPLLQSTYDRQFDKTTRFTPDESLAFIAVLAAVAACTVSLALDCARTNTAVVLALAMIGGTVVRELVPSKFGVRLAPVVTQRARWMRISALTVPCVVLPLATLTVLKAQGATAAARDMLSRLMKDCANDRVEIATETKLGALELARERCETALSLTPGNAEAKHLLARVTMTRFRIDAKNTGLGDALAMAAAADSAMPGRPEIAFTHVELLRTHGRFAEATVAVDRLFAAAPQHPDSRLEYVRTHISEPARHPELEKLLEELLRHHPGNTEARRLRRIIRLSAD